ncbi:MAG: hypothetical protein ABR582_16690 [Gemmatimonadaceae bacterium]
MNVTERDDRATVAVFVSISATVIAALYYVGQAGLGHPLRPIIMALGVSLFISVSPFIAWWLTPRTHYDPPEPWWRSQAFLTLVALGVTAIRGAHLESSIVVIPLFFNALLLLAVEAKKEWSTGSNLAGRPLRSDYASWFVFAAAIIGVFPTAALESMGIRSSSTLTSPSYVTSIAIFFLVVSTAIIYWTQRKSSHRKTDLLFLLIFAPGVVAICGLLQPATMLILLAAAIGVALLARLFRDPIVLLSAFLCIAAGVVVYRFATVPDANKAFFTADAAWWSYFVLVQFFWTWLYVYSRIREENLQTFGEVRRAAIHGQITDVAALLLIAIVGLVGGVIANFHGGPALYFSDVQRWLALGLLMAAIPNWIAKRRAHEPEPRGQSLRLSRIGIAVLAIPIGITMILNATRYAGAVLRSMR